MTKIKVNGTIRTTRDMLVNISKSVAAATAKNRVDFNAIKNVKLYMVIIPESLETLLKIHNSLNYMGYKNNVESYILTKTHGYININQFVRLYLKFNKVNNIDVNIPYNQFNKIDYKYLRYELNHIKNILCPYHKDSTYVWTKEYDTYDGTFICVCSEEEYGAQQSESTFTIQTIMDDISVTIHPLPKDEKFLVKYMSQKKLKFDSYVNNTLVPKIEKKSIITKDDIDIASSYIFGDGYDKECIRYLVKEVLLDKAYMDLDKQVYDEYAFETNMLVLIHYVCEGDIDKEMMYQNLLDEIITNMWVVGYFREPDEVLYDEE